MIDARSEPIVATPAPAASISLFGLESGTALAAVVGALIEMPLMLLVRVVNRSRDRHECRPSTP